MDHEFTARRLCGLCGELSVYNGRLIRNFKLLPDGRIRVAVPKTKKELESTGSQLAIELVIKQKFTEIVIDHDEINRQKIANNKAALESNKGPGLGIAHGLEQRFISLLAQLRGKVKEFRDTAGPGASIDQSYV